MSWLTDLIKDRYTTVSSGVGPTQPRLDLGNIVTDLGVAGALYGIINPNDSSGLASFFGTGGRQQPVGYTGGIPNYMASRELAPNAFAQTYTTPTGELAPRRPGAAGRRYFTDTTFTQDTGTPFMGITAEQIAAQNQAAQDERDLFETLLGSVAAGTTGTAGTAGTATTGTTGTATTGTTGTAGTTAQTTEQGNEYARRIMQEPGEYNFSVTDEANYFRPAVTFGLFDQGLTPEQLMQAGGAFEYIYPGSAGESGLRQAYEYWQQTRAGTGGTTTGTTTGGADTDTTVTGGTDTTVKDITDYLIDLGFGGEGRAPTSDDIDSFLTSGFELDTILDTLGVDTDEEKVAVASLTNNPFAKINILDGATDTNFNRDLLAAQEASKNFTGNPFAGLFRPSLSAVDASDGISSDEQDYIAGMITNNQANIADVAEQFDVSQADVIEGLLRGKYQTPEEIAATLNAVVPDTEFTEEALIANLLETGRTTPEEVAAYYGVPVEAVTARYRELGGTKFARGGNVNGYYLGGTTDGMADQIPATINNMQPAALSDGEFVIPADVVSHLGNGNSDAGAKQLYSMMERVRKDRTGNPKQGRQIDPNKYLA